MNLVIILIAVAIEHFFGALSKLRRLDWFDALVAWLDKRLSAYGIWNGPVGVLAVVSLPLLIAWGIYSALNDISGFLGALLVFLFSVIVLVYSLGPQNLEAQVASILEALKRNDEQQVARLTQELVRSNEPIGAQSRGSAIVESILVQANERLFGVLFWFIVLGPLGALLFRFSSQLRLCAAKVASSRFNEYATYLYNWLVWIPARLVALGYALSGSLTHALKAWRLKETFFTLDYSDSTLKESGMGALQFDPSSDDMWKREEAERVNSAQGLVVRTLVIWLVVLALVTLVGWVSLKWAGYR